MGLVPGRYQPLPILEDRPCYTHSKYAQHPITYLVPRDGQPRDDLSFCPEDKLFAPSVVKFYRMSFPSIGINWENVTQVHADQFSVDECLTAVRLAPLLVDCKFLAIITNRHNYLVHEDQQFTNIHLEVLVLRALEPAIDNFFGIFLFHLSKSWIWVWTKVRTAVCPSTLL